MFFFIKAIHKDIITYGKENIHFINYSDWYRERSGNQFSYNKKGTSPLGCLIRDKYLLTII